MRSRRSGLNLRVKESLLCCSAWSPSLSAGSSQPAEAETKTQSMSHQSDTLHLPCGQMRGQGLGSQGTRTQPMEMMHLQQTIEKHIMQLAARHQQQDLVLGDQRHHQATGEQEALLGNLMSQLVNLLQSGTTGGLGLQPSCPSLDVRGDVGGGQGAQSAGQPDQPVHQVKDPEATFVSQHLCNRGIETSASYWASFQDYKMYQGDKYHEDKNPLVRMGGGERHLLEGPDH